MTVERFVGMRRPGVYFLPAKTGDRHPVRKITVRHTAGQRYPEIVGYELGEFGEDRENNPFVADDDVDYDDIPF